MGKVKVLMPLVEIAGDEMAQVTWDVVTPGRAPLAGPGRVWVDPRAFIAAAAAHLGQGC